MASALGRVLAAPHGFGIGRAVQEFKDAGQVYEAPATNGAGLSDARGADAVLSDELIEVRARKPRDGAMSA